MTESEKSRDAADRARGASSMSAGVRGGRFLIEGDVELYITLACDSGRDASHRELTND